ncbi:hypothetical protein PT277_04630 [Acetobacteraceae bacterium ESL0709]|nr:hypothetical protein [Acetobacteraceae bacterium ESL0697]MDF7677981.1 hypothetical protein [Acetobacteraceae bacterium ESL0709]
MTIYTEDGNSYAANFTIPTRIHYVSIIDLGHQEDETNSIKDSNLIMVFILDSGTKLPTTNVKRSLGKDNLTITNAPVSQEFIEADKPNKVTGTDTHSDRSQENYSYKSLPDTLDMVDDDKFILSAPVNPVSDLHIANAVYNRGIGLAILPEEASHSEFFYPAEQSAHALTYSDTDARPTTIRTLKNGFWGAPPTYRAK